MKFIFDVRDTNFNFFNFLILAYVISAQKHTYESNRHFSSSTVKYNEEITELNEAIILSDSCVKRIKEISDDSGYLRIMVILFLFLAFLLYNVVRF